MPKTIHLQIPFLCFVLSTVWLPPLTMSLEKLFYSRIIYTFISVYFSRYSIFIRENRRNNGNVDHSVYASLVHLYDTVNVPSGHRSRARIVCVCAVPRRVDAHTCGFFRYFFFKYPFFPKTIQQLYTLCPADFSHHHCNEHSSHS